MTHSLWYCTLSCSADKEGAGSDPTAAVVPDADYDVARLKFSPEHFYPEQPNTTTVGHLAETVFIYAVSESVWLLTSP